MQTSEQHERLGRVVARALRDVSYKKRLMEATAEVLDEAGVDVPEGTDLVVVENTASCTYLTLPYIPHPRPLPISNEYVSGTWQNTVVANTPKDVGCCGGGSSIGAHWLEDAYDPADAVANQRAR